MKRWLYKKLKKDVWEAFNWEIEKEKNLEEVCFVVFDTETTGLDLKRDEAISIGAVKIEGLKIDISKSFYRILKPSKDYGESIKVHGITPRDLKEGKERKEVCEEFINYSMGCILAGFFVHIDIAMIRNLVEKECEGIFYPYAIDLLDMLEDQREASSLEDLLKRYKLPASVFHNALEDAYMTALLLLRSIKYGNYKKVKDLPLKVF
ncbi:MAG: exonuclease domain-containing protein [Aquificaceae bacterium]